MSDFILESAVTQAERVLPDRRWFAASAEQHEEFLRLLDAPMETPRLAALFAEESPFGRELEAR